MHPQDTAPLEAWRPVIGYEGWYSVSDLGRVRAEYAARAYRAGRILKGTPNANGYPSVSLHGIMPRRVVQIHQLVAAAFIGPCPTGHEVNHRDGCKTNNHPTNLEYVTPSGNHQHARLMGLRADGARHWTKLHPERVARGPRRSRKHLPAHIVTEIRHRYAAGTWTYARLAATYGIGIATVGNILRRRSWRYLP